MKCKLILIPVLVGAILMPGCSSPVANYLPFPLNLVSGGSVRCGSCDSGAPYQFDDSAARNTSEAASQMDDWQREQEVQQETAAAIQASDDATAAAAASAAASAAAGIGQ